MKTVFLKVNLQLRNVEDNINYNISLEKCYFFILYNYNIIINREDMGFIRF